MKNEHLNLHERKELPATNMIGNNTQFTGRFDKNIFLLQNGIRSDNS